MQRDESFEILMPPFMSTVSLVVFSDESGQQRGRAQTGDVSIPVSDHQHGNDDEPEQC
jgi:hypothetical protein